MKPGGSAGLLELNFQDVNLGKCLKAVEQRGGRGAASAAEGLKSNKWSY